MCLSIYHHRTKLAQRPFLTNYKAISKEENAHPEAVLLVAGDFNAGKLICFTKFLPACHMCNQRIINHRPPLLQI
jgi:hypothetical protein